jgi:nitrogen fixation protein FixH
MSAQKQKSFKLTGWHVLAGMVLFFAVIIAVNSVMMTLALKSFPGEDQKKSYMQGLKYNDVLTARAEQNALGWQAIMLDGTRLAKETTTVRIRIADVSGNPVTGLQLDGEIRHPATDREDRLTTLTENTAGIYEGSFDGLSKGRWLLSVRTQTGSVQQFSARTELWLQ